MIILNKYLNKEGELKNKIFAFVFVFLFTVIYLFGARASTVFSAEFYFDMSKKTLKSGDLVEVTLMLDTEGETVNATEGSVSFSGNLVLEQVRSGNSLVSLWVDPPTAEGDHINFSGIIPGGYSGELGPDWVGTHPGRVFSLIFEARESGEAWVQVDRASTVLLHDGKGTPARVTIKDTNVKVLEGEKKIPANVIDWEDQERPEPFDLKLELFPDGFYYLIFVANDKGSGIDYYDVREEGWSFVVAKSPYLLKEQRLGVPITLRAVDKNGNKRLAFLSPEKRFVWYESTKTHDILFTIGIVIIFFMFAFVYKSRWRKNVK